MSEYHELTAAARAELLRRIQPNLKALFEAYDMLQMLLTVDTHTTLTPQGEKIKGVHAARIRKQLAALEARKP